MKPVIGYGINLETQIEYQLKYEKLYNVLMGINFFYVYKHKNTWSV